MRNVSVQQTNVVHVPHERQERRPHKEFTTACIIHLISNTPPRCEAIRHSATMRSSKGLAFWYVLSVHRYVTHTRCSTKSVDVPSSGRLMTGRLVVQFLAGLTDPFIHFHMYNWMSNDFARSVNAFPRVDMLSLLRFTRSLLVSVPSSIEIPSTGSPQTYCLPPEGECRGAVH